MTHLECDVLIIGAGIVGLAVAEAVTRQPSARSVVLVERHKQFGQEISSHNSEVIHSGIYYKSAPLKARHCVRGKELLYRFCEQHSVPFRKCGKYIVATDASHLGALDGIQEAAATNGVKLERFEGNQARRALDNPSVVAALYSPTTGIVDSHVLMERLEFQAQFQGAIPTYSHVFNRVIEATPSNNLIELETPDKGRLLVRARAVVNAAGLGAARIANQFGKTEFQIRPCRGRYYSLSAHWAGRYESLIYPTPDPTGGLGVHLTFDLGGRCRLGPDVDWSYEMSTPDDLALYRFSEPEGLKERFFDSAKKLIPGLLVEDLSEDYIGVRPKIFRNGKLHLDFVVERGLQNGTDWHLLGIESPGLTAALSLAEDIAQEIRELV